MLFTIIAFVTSLFTSTRGVFDSLLGNVITLLVDGVYDIKLILGTASGSLIDAGPSATEHVTVNTSSLFHMPAASTTVVMLDDFGLLSDLTLVQLGGFFVSVLLLTSGLLYFEPQATNDGLVVPRESCSAVTEDNIFGLASSCGADDEAFWADLALKYGIYKSTIEDTLRTTTAKYADPLGIILSGLSSSLPDSNVVLSASSSLGSKMAPPFQSQLPTPAPLIAVTEAIPIHASVSISPSPSASLHVSRSLGAGCSFLPSSLSTCSDLVISGCAFGMVLSVRPSFSLDLEIDHGTYLRSALGILDADATPEDGFWPELDEYVTREEDGWPAAWYTDEDEMRGWIFPGWDNVPEFRMEEVGHDSADEEDRKRVAAWLKAGEEAEKG